MSEQSLSLQNNGEIVFKSTQDLIPYATNPRKNKKAVRAIAESIRKYGFQQPIVVDKKNVIVVGHTRLDAAKSLGLKTVPCVVMDAPDEEVREYRVLDNKLNELAEWDFALLADELKAMDLSDDIFGLAFTEAELHEIFNPEIEEVDSTEDKKDKTPQYVIALDKESWDKFIEYKRSLQEREGYDVTDVDAINLLLANNEMKPF